MLSVFEIEITKLLNKGENILPDKIKGLHLKYFLKRINSKCSPLSTCDEQMFHLPIIFHFAVLGNLCGTTVVQVADPEFLDSGHHNICCEIS